MRRKTLLIVMLIAAIALAVSGCGGAEQDPSAVTLYMGFRPDVQFAPFYVAVEEGYFAEQGLEVTLLHESSESTMARLVATGEAEFAIVSGEQVMLARAQEVPIVYVYEWFDRYPVAIAAKADSGIAVPEDLAGRSVGVPLLSGASYMGLEALLANAGLSDDDITLEATGFTQVETLMTDRVEAVVVYAANEPVQLEAQGVDVNIITVADYVDLVSNGLITSETIADEDPEIVKGMTAAISEAIRFISDDTDSAFEISKKYVEGLDDPDVEDTQKAVLTRSVAFWTSDGSGQSDLASWENMQELLLDVGLLEGAVDLDSAFTNEFLP